MGKDKKGKKKPGAGKEKTEKKTAKAAEKRQRREEKKVKEEDDIDQILARIKKEEAKKVEVVVEDNVLKPSPRCNATVVVNPSKDTELIVYGGEFYNGDKTYVYGDLYRYACEKREWRSVSSPNSPPPRSGHQAVAWKNHLFVFGGEFTSPNQERFHHYKDLWRLDLTSNQWEMLDLKNGPSARSGHRMVLYKHRLILFGGFYDTLREVRYYNDLHVLDLDDYKWQEVKPKPGAAWPAPRSACQMVVHQDEVLLYGGYFKDSSGDPEASDRGVVFSDLWSLDPRSWEWNKVKRLGTPPGPRAGFSMCVQPSKRRAILFGGVVDVEEKGGDVLRSTFLNDMYVFQMDVRRWYPLQLRATNAKKQQDKSGSKAQRPSATHAVGSTPAEADDSASDDDGDDSNQRRRQSAGTKDGAGATAGESDEEEEGEQMSGRRRRRLRKKYGKGLGLSSAADSEAAEADDDMEEDDEEVDMEGEDTAEGTKGNALEGDAGKVEGASAMEMEAEMRVGANMSATMCVDALGDALATTSNTAGGEKAADPESSSSGVGRNSCDGGGTADSKLAQLSLEERESASAAAAAPPPPLPAPAPGSEAALKEANQETAEAGAPGSAVAAAVAAEQVWPCGRMNAALVVGGGGVMYLWGGVREVEKTASGEKEVTLDDLYSLDLNKLDNWKCEIEALESMWVEAGDGEDDDDDDEDDEDEPRGGNGGQSDDDDESSDDDGGDDTAKEELTSAESAAALLRGEVVAGRQLSRKERRAEIERLRNELGLADADRTPMPGETLREFFARTTGYWQQAAYERTRNAGKELRRDGFDLCESRYRELRPVLVELERLEADQKAEEAAAKAAAARAKAANAASKPRR